MFKTTQNNAPPYMNVREAAKFVTLCERSLRGLIAAGKIRSIRKGRRIILRTSDLVKYMENEPTTKGQ